MKKAIFGVFALLSTQTQAIEISYPEFEAFKQKFHREYSSAQQEGRRREIFYKNLNMIEVHNADPTATFKMGVNQFTDRTEQEFMHSSLGLKIPK